MMAVTRLPSTFTVIQAISSKRICICRSTVLASIPLAKAPERTPYSARAAVMTSGSSRSVPCTSTRHTKRLMASSPTTSSPAPIHKPVRRR